MANNADILNEKNALIRASIRRDSVAGAHYIDYVDMLYAEKKAHQLDIDTLRVFVSE